MNEQGRNLSLRMLLVSSGILLSRVLGLARDIVFAYVFGTGTALAAFVIANTFPNLLRHLFGEGAFSHAMVPVFSERLEKEGRAAAWQGACRVVTALLMAVAGLVLLGITAALLLRQWFTGELSGLTLTLVVWLLPYAVLVCGSAAFAAVLNTAGRFGVPAYSQTIMNAVLIVAALGSFWLWAGREGEDRIWFLVAGVLAAGVLQVFIHLRACRRCFASFRFDFDLGDPMVAKVARLMLPALLGAGVMQINIVVDRILAGWLGEVAATSLYYSQRLVYLPVGLFGVAMGIVALPMMSRAWARKEKKQMLESLGGAFRYVIFLTLPTVAVLTVLRFPIIRLLFERGGFTSESTAATAWAMLFYLPGIPAFACAKIAVTPFYARHNTSTPVKVAVFCLVLNVILNLILMQFLEQGGLALATTICSTLNVLILLIITIRQLGGGVLLALLKPVFKMTAAAGLAYLAAAAVLKWLPFEDEDMATLLFQVGASCLAAGMVYLTATLALGCRELKDLAAGLRAQR